MLRNRKEHDGTANLKQEWIVEKTDSLIRFESVYRTGEYLTGDLEYDDFKILKKQFPGDRRRMYIHWLYTGSENPTWWKVTPADS